MMSKVGKTGSTANTRKVRTLEAQAHYGRIREQASRVGFSEYVECDMSDVAIGRVAEAHPKGFLCTMINVPWYIQEDPWLQTPTTVSHRRVTVAELRAAVGPHLRTISQNTFVAIWVDKTYLAEVILWMEEESYLFVENYQWTRLSLVPGQAITPGRCLQRRKEILILFRSPSRDVRIELRHQRVPDVTSNLIPPNYPANRDTKPLSAIEMVETMLPCGEAATPQFLYLWAPRGFERPGWVTVADNRGIADHAEPLA